MTDTLDRPDVQPDNDRPEREPFLGLSPLQVMAGALAATTTAVATSYLGAAGTLIGAALASIISTVAAAVYTQSMDAARGRIVSGIRTLGDRRGDDVAGHTSRTGSTAVAGEDADAARPGLWSRLRAAIGRIGKRAWLGTAAVFLMAIVAITGFEMATGQPVSATVSGGSSSGTTIGTVVTPGGETPGTTDESGSEEDPGTDPGTQDGTTPGDQATPTADPTQQQGVQPGQDATQAPAPQDPAPEQSVQPDSGQGDSGTGDSGTGEQPATGGGQGDAPAQGEG